MQRLNQTLKSVLVVTALLATTAEARADEEKVFAGTIEINSTQLAFIISGKSGGGVLEFEGQEYNFDLVGLGVGGIGVQKINAVGAVYNMTDISKFSGYYTEARIGATIGSASKGAMQLGNKHGVLIDLKSSGSKGLALSTGVDGLTIKLRK